jgi:hypothetical protein
LKKREKLKKWKKREKKIPLYQEEVRLFLREGAGLGGKTPMSRLSVVGAFLAGVLLVAACVVVYGPGPDMPTLAEKKAMLKVEAQKQMLLLDEPYTTEQKPIKQILLLHDREKPIKQVLLLNEAGTVFTIVCPRRYLSLAFLCCLVTWFVATSVCS